MAKAFVLPRGVTLNAGQQAAYDQLKADKEQELRDAIDDVQDSHGAAATAQATKKLRAVRASITAAIYDIVNGNAASVGQGRGSEGSSYVPPGGYAPQPAPGYAPGYYSPYPYQPYGSYPYYYGSGDGSRKYYSSGSGTATTGGGKYGKYPPSYSSTSRPYSGKPPSKPSSGGGASSSGGTKK